VDAHALLEGRGGAVVQRLLLRHAEQLLASVW
jgi:hypothetical protein